MKKIPLYFFALCLLLSSCTARQCESCNRKVDRHTKEAQYEIKYYGLMGDQIRHEDHFTGFLHNDEGIDIWYIKGGNPDTTIQIMRGDFGTTVVKSWAK